MEETNGKIMIPQLISYTVKYLQKIEKNPTMLISTKLKVVENIKYRAITYTKEGISKKMFKWRVGLELVWNKWRKVKQWHWKAVTAFGL